MNYEVVSHDSEVSSKCIGHITTVCEMISKQLTDAAAWRDGTAGDVAVSV